jgi:hypothetical protein
MMPLIAAISLAITVANILFNLRKDAHHVRLELSEIDHIQTVLGINNDSSVPFGILSVGYMQSSNRIEWIEYIGNHYTNKLINYPVKVEARSLFTVDLCPYRNKIPHNGYGVCIQLETGRIYILKHELPLYEYIKIRIAASISRFSRGKFFPGMPQRPRLPNKPFH